MQPAFVVLLLLLLLGVVVAFGWRPLRRLLREIRIEHARELFNLQRARLEDEFFRAAASSGKPCGLRWNLCEWEQPVEFVRERATGQLAALVGVSIAFEAIEGGDMEGVEAVANLRNASAVFVFDRGHWQTTGKAIFNMNPDEALHHFRNQYERADNHT